MSGSLEQTKPKLKHPARRKGRLRREGRSVRPGIAPGSLSVDPNAPKPEISVFAYGPEPESEQFVEKKLKSPSQVGPLLEKWPTVWIDVVGLGDLKVVEKLGEIFGLHKLALEDVLNLNQRPKVEEYASNLYIVAKLTSLTEHIQTEQISIFLGTKFVLTFQERKGDCFDGVRERLRHGKGRIRIGAEYLAYALLDSIVDHNFPVLDKFGEELEQLEEEVIERPDKKTIARIYTIKRDLTLLRRAVWPLRELVNALMREDTPFITPDTRMYVRDCYDHVIQVMDMIENYREVASGLIDAYLSSQSNRMNDVMKMLTLIATIFIPLSFIAGVYGMNFNPDASPLNMPELNFIFGYPMALGIMTVVALGMLYFFKRKGWIGRQSKKS